MADFPQAAKLKSVAQARKRPKDPLLRGGFGVLCASDCEKLQLELPNAKALPGMQGGFSYNSSISLAMGQPDW